MKEDFDPIWVATDVSPDIAEFIQSARLVMLTMNDGEIIKRAIASGQTLAQGASAFIAQLVGEFDDQDAVLGDQADQRHQPDLAIDVERAASQPQRQQRTDHGAEGHGVDARQQPQADGQADQAAGDEGQHSAHVEAGVVNQRGQDRDGDENWRLYLLDLTTDAEARLITPGDGIQARILGHNRWNPTAVLIALNNRMPQLHDVHRLDLTSGELTLVAENPGFIEWLVDTDLALRGGTTMAPGPGWRGMRGGSESIPVAACAAMWLSAASIASSSR